MRYIRTNSLKRLFSLKRRSFEGDVNGIPSPTALGGEDKENPVSDTPPSAEISKRKNHCDDTSPAAAAEDSQRRPAWRCFSYEEIHAATDGFSPGSDSCKALGERFPGRKIPENCFQFLRTVLVLGS